MPVRGRGRGPTPTVFSTCVEAVGGADCGAGDAATADGLAMCVFTLGRAASPEEPGGSGNSDSGSWPRTLLTDMDRTGAMTDAETERGGTIRDTAATRGGTRLLGREPGFESVRVRCRVGVDLLAPTIFALAEATGGRDSVIDVERVTDGWAAIPTLMPAVCGRRKGRGTAVREGVVAWELVTDCGALLESREPDETIELADAFDCVRLRVGRTTSTDVTLSLSAALRRF